MKGVFFSDVCRYQDTLEVDVLVGADYIWEFQNRETIRGGQHEPIAVKTTLGWVLSGPLKGERSYSSLNCSHVVVNHVIDSKIANNGEWKNFVRHRENEILKLTKKEVWGHVPGVENPADIGSRVAKASELRDSKLWWEGPKWLKEEKETWPNNEPLEDSNEVSEERKKASVLTTSVAEEESESVSKVIDINRFSKLGKLLRVTSYVKRFIDNLKKKRVGDRYDLRESECRGVEECRERLNQRCADNTT